MKRSILVATVATLSFIFSASVAKNLFLESESSALAQSNQLKKKFFEISPAGALVKAQTPQGIEIFSARPSNEGYSFTYELFGAKGTPLKKNNLKTVSIAGRFYNEGLVYCAECEAIRKKLNLPPLKDNQALASARTTDGALMITSSFIYEGDKLKVYRVFQNVSADPYLREEGSAKPSNVKKPPKPVTVRLYSLQTQNDALITSAQTQVRLGEFKALKQSAMMPASNRNHYAYGFLPSSASFAITGCGVCPTECEFELNLGSFERGTICIDCPGRLTDDRRLKYAPSVSAENAQTGTFVRVSRTMDAEANDCDSPITVNFATHQGPASNGGASITLDSNWKDWAVCPLCENGILVKVHSEAVKSPKTRASFCTEECKPVIFVTRDERPAKFFGPFNSAVTPCTGRTAMTNSTTAFLTGFANPAKSNQQRQIDSKKKFPPPISRDLKPGEGIVLVIEYDLSRTKR